VRPLQWNPDWESATCENNGCDDPDLAWLEADVEYTQRLRFVGANVVEVQMKVDNLADVAHAETVHEFPTMYVSFGEDGTQDLNVLIDSNGTQVAIDVDVGGGFFYKNFTSSGGWVTLQNGAHNYGVGIYYENRLTDFQAWQGPSSPKFNNVRSLFPFALPAYGEVRARAYLILGSYDTIHSIAGELDATLPPFGWLDAPAESEHVSGIVEFTGWALDNKVVTSVLLRIDGEFVADLEYGDSRPDVCAVFPGYAGCDGVGFLGEADLSGFAEECAHLVEIEAEDGDGNARVIYRTQIFVD